MKNNHSSNLKNEVLRKIKGGEALMRPKWQFVLGAVLLVLGVIITLLALLYLASFIIFTMRQTGAWFVPIFGFRGLYAFLVSAPWFLILVAAVFVVILELLVRHYSFAYRKPLLYSVLGIVLLVVIGGFATVQTPLHSRLLRHAEERKLPIAGPFYRGYGMRHFENVHRGTITEITEDGFTIQNRREETITIVTTPQTRFPLGTDFIEGDSVVIFGERDKNTVQAFGIRRINDATGRPRRSDMHSRFRALFPVR